MSKMKRHEQIDKEISTLQTRISLEAPKHGYAPPLHQKVAFRTLPMSEWTLQGLENAKKSFSTMTDIQNACIPHALAGRDVLGAARTGSGKTLAYLIPVLEKLFREKYCSSDGCGAIILSSTRELALQIFDVLREVGAYHSLTAGLLVGGKREFFLEQRHVGRTNILVATPGRLLQHLEQTPDLSVDQLQVLVLDEADRILDLGFRTQVTRILDYLPNERQTMLFSATQTRKVSDLAALSLKQPEYLGVHDKEKTSTPESLKQSVVIVPLEHKLNAVYSFIKSHLKCKVIVFLASCSQVRHAWEMFCSLQPGIPIMALHGKIVQERRTKIFFDYLQKPNAVLFATDVAARGLDFPDIDWVIQMDAPEDKDMYIHRAGRTARHKSGGKALLMLTPSEESFIGLLTDAKIPITKLSINPTKTVLVTQKSAALVASRAYLKDLAQKAFKSYVRSMYLMPNKDVFDVSNLPLDEYAVSLGLSCTPKLQFLKKAVDREQLRDKKNVNHKLHRLKEQIKAEKLAKRVSKLGENPKKRELSTEKEEDEMLIIKQKHVSVDFNDPPDSIPTNHTKPTKRIKIDGSNGQNKRIMFNEDGKEEDDTITTATSNKPTTRDQLATSHDEYLRKVRERLETTKEMDNIEAKARVREKHRNKRLKEKGDNAENSTNDDNKEDVIVTLARDSDSESSSDDGNESEDSDGADKVVDIKTQEELALALIRGS